MITKVCGITTKKQYDALCEHKIEMIGFNFYPGSKRCVSNDSELAQIAAGKSLRVGVFVNASFQEVLGQIKRFKLDAVQLHGDESPLFCEEIGHYALVIKVFRLKADENFDKCELFTSPDFFLFDTYSESFGGTGKKFNWKLLDQYKGNTPFLLSGGIGPEDVEAIQHINHNQFIGVDINSKFETAPGLKNIKAVLAFNKEIRESHAVSG